MTEQKIEPGVTVIPESIQSASQIYADGLGVMIGIPVSKIQFHTTAGLDGKTGKELRQITLQANVSTSTLIDFCKQTLKGMADNEKTLSEALDKFNATVLLSAEKVSKS